MTSRCRNRRGLGGQGLVSFSVPGFMVVEVGAADKSTDGDSPIHPEGDIQMYHDASPVASTQHALIKERFSYCPVSAL